jgi:tripartite-type tricarboxylate transporter receptor subunit TctC
MSTRFDLRRSLIAAALATSALAMCGALAQTYPTKAIRVISTFGAGSPADALVRALSQKMSESMGQPVIVEAQPGASGVVGAQLVARAAPDGYTLLMTIPTTLVATPFLLKTRPYDPLKDFTPITAAMDAATCIMVSTSLPVNSMQDLIAYAKANPGKVPYGSNGIGGTYHMEMEAIKLKYGLDMTHVPYKGGTAALQAAANGEIPVAFSPLSSALPFQKSGKVKVLAILDTKRYPGAPDIPSMAEQVPGYEKTPTGSFYYGPAGMPRPIVMRLYEEVARAVKQPDVLERMHAIAFFPTVNTPDEFLEQTKREIEIAARAIKIAKIPVEQ